MIMMVGSDEIGTNVVGGEFGGYGCREPDRFKA